MASNPIDCIKLHAKYLSTDENISREAATDMALKEFEKLHGELENFKKSINPKYTKKAYISPDKSEAIKKITDDYQKQIDEANTPIPEPIKAEEKPQPEKTIVEDKQGAGKEPPIEPPKKEGVDGDGNLSGIKKGLVSEEVIKGVDLERISDKQMMSLGRKILDTGEVKPEALVTKIITDGKGVLTPTEVVGLITYKRDIDNALQDAYEKYNEKLNSGDEVGTLGVEIANIERQIADFEVMSVITAQQQSLAFRLRQKMLDREYNIATQIEKYKKNNNGSIPAEVEAKFRQLDKELKEVKAKLAEAEKIVQEKEGQEAVDNIKESVDREKKYTDEEIDKKVQEGVESEINKIFEQLPTEKKRAGDKAIAALQKFRAKLKNKTYESTLGIPVAIADLGAVTAIRAIKVGRSIAEAVEMGINRIKKALKEKGIDKWEKEADYRKDLTDTLEAEGVQLKQVNDKPIINEDGTVKIPNQMLRDLVERGVTDINDLVDAVHRDVVKDLPNIEKRQVRDYITNYGKEVNPTSDEIQKQINTAKRIGRLLSEVEDLQKMDKIQFAAKYLKPKPSKEKIPERERELKQMVKSLGGGFMGDVVGKTKEARTNSQRLEDAKKKVNDSIENIRDEIITKERELKEKQKPLNEDLELARLKESEAALKNLRDKYLPEQKDAFENEKARERVKDKLVDEIIDLNEQINAGEKRAKDATPKFADDAQLNKLREIKKAKQGVLDIIDPRGKEEVRVKSAIKATEKSLAEYERRLREKDTSSKAREVKPTTAELNAVREKRDAARKEYEEFKKTVPKTEAQVLSESKSRATTRIKELETKIRKKDFAKPVKKVKPTDTELRDLQHKKELLHEEFDKEQYKLELKNRKWWQKAEDIALEVFTGISRTLVAGVDLSAGLVQGVWRWFRDPKMSARATGEMFRQFASEKRNAEWFSKLKASGSYEKIKQSKLAVTDEQGRASVKEGLFIVNWANKIYDGLAYLITAGYKPATNFVRKVNPIKASQRAFDGYVNYIRVAKYLDLVRIAEKDGYTIEADPKIFEKLADHVNTTTGRGSMGALETSSKWLSVAMFAPRKVISEIKLFTPYAFLYYAKMPKYVRQKALLDFAKFAASYVGVNTAIWAASQVLQGKGFDDDDDHFWDITSSQFFTHRFGNTRLNIGGGMKSALVFQGRLYSGVFTDQYGKSTKLGDRYGKQVNTRLDLGLRYLMGKASPGMGATIKKLDEKKGLEVDDESLMKDLIIPMWMQDAKELYKDHPTEIGTLFNILSIFGANIRNVEPKKQDNPVQIKDPRLQKDFERTTNDEEKGDWFSANKIVARVEYKGEAIEMTDKEKKKFKEDVEAERIRVIDEYFEKYGDSYNQKSDIQRKEKIDALQSKARENVSKEFIKQHEKEVEAIKEEIKKQKEQSRKEREERSN